MNTIKDIKDVLKQIDSNDRTILVYRYMWLFEGSENMCIKVLSGVAEEHKQFIEALKNNNRVIKAVRTYLHEYDVNLIEFYESIKDIEEKGGE